MTNSEHKKGGKNGSQDSIAAYFQGMEEILKPLSEKSTKTKDELTISLKLIDAESGKVRACSLDEAESWNWEDFNTMRIINDRQVKSFDHLIDVLCYKELKGDKEVSLYEFPRFMFLCGG
ncbi:MAG: hypothetical protein WCQ90_04565 [Deltaproteobacteria bacterium]